jgi:voltage-gated potassium channel
MPDAAKPSNAPSPGWRQRLHEVIFEADTRAGKVFDVALLAAITLSVVAVMLESVVYPIDGDVTALPPRQQRYLAWLYAAEWVFTILFTIEYVLRIICVRRPWRYIFSFYGIVDLLAVLPTYIGLALPGVETQRLAVVRALRLLRAFRVFKLAYMLSEARLLRRAIWSSRAKIAVFLSVIIISVTIMGSAMHLIEGHEAGFTSIPQSMYWAIVTMTTVGYGDIAPQTPLGKLLAAAMMILGYSMIIVPTGIVSAELVQQARKPLTTQACPHCMAEGHDRDAKFCKYCGGRL